MEHIPDNETPAPKAAYGSVLSILLIVAILVMGAFYMWNKRTEQYRLQYASPDDGTSVDIEAEVQ